MSDVIDHLSPLAFQARKDLDRFGRFTVLDKLATGGMAELYRVRHPQYPDQVFALKCIRSDCDFDPEFRAMLRDEAEILAQLEHPNLNRVEDLVQDGHQMGLVLEYVEGLDIGRLRRFLKSEGQTLPLSAVLHIVICTLRGLHYAHTARDAHGSHLNIVHRDVSPGNIMVDVHGQVKLVDFGIARARRRFARTEAGNVKGKFRYMAPEQIQGEPPGPRADMYSSAMLLWELMANRRIYDEIGIPQLMLKVANAEVPSLEDARPRLPRALIKAYRKATALRPEDRFQTAEDFARALAATIPAADLSVARLSLADLVRRARQRESQEKLERAVARARAAAAEQDLEGAILCALETPDRVSQGERISAVPVDDSIALFSEPTEIFEPLAEPPTKPMDPIGPSMGAHATG